jgi:hypothetical protein
VYRFSRFRDSPTESSQNGIGILLYLRLVLSVLVVATTLRTPFRFIIVAIAAQELPNLQGACARAIPHGDV